MASVNADTSPTVWTVAALLQWTREHLQKRGIESPRLCAELLLAHALSCERIELYTRHELTPEPAVLERFRATIREAAAGKPIAYLIGYREFFSLRFEVTPDVLIPRPDTEVLVERTIDLVRKSEVALKRIADIGAGSGCIAIALARNLPGVEITAGDVSAAALAVARRNAERLGVKERVTLVEGDLFAPLDGQVFDVIVSNPPYIGRGEAASLAANVRDFEPHLALFAGEDGLDVIRRLAVEAGPRLSAGGHMLLEVAFNQAAAVRDLLAAAGWVNIRTYRDGGGHERVVHAERP